MTTHSERACFRDCPRKRLLRYDYKLRPVEEPGYLKWGRAWALLHEGKPIDDMELDPYDRAALEVMFKAYPFKFEYVGVEVEYKTRFDAGKIDAIVKLQDGRLAILERKSTRDLDANYWTRLEFDAQTTGYFIAARELGHDVQTIVYDVVEKPTIRPHKATPEEKRKYKADGTLYASQRAFDETPAEFAARVAEWVAAEHRFHMREVGVTDQKVQEWLDDMHTQTAVIRMGAAWRNPAACVVYTPCEYLPVCHRTDLDTNTPDGFRRGAEKHEELTASSGQAEQK